MDGGFLFVFLALISISLSVLFGKITTKFFSGKVVAFLSQAIGAILLIPMVFIISPSFVISLPVLLIVSAIGILNAVAYIFYYKAISKEKASIVGTFVATYGAISSFIGLFFFKEEFTISKIAAIPIIFISISFVLINPMDLKQRLLSKTSFVYCLIAIICWGLLFPVLKFSGDYMDTVTPVILGRICSAFLLFPILSPQDKASFKDLKKSGILKSVLALSFFNAISFVFYTLAVKDIDVSIAIPIYTSYPIIAAVLAWGFLNEKIPRHSWIGIIGVVLSMILLKLNL